jgi:hypothetical protein
MALQGSYTFKGIVLSESYCNVSNLNYYKRYDKTQNLVSEKTYNSDGSIDQEAVYEDVYTTSISSNFSLNIYKDVSSKSSNPNLVIDSKSFSFTPSIADGADNFIMQAYTYLKTLDEYDGYTDV